jgi:hypothetical protein
VQTMTEKLMTYALGRGVDYRDMPAVRGIVQQAAREHYRFSSLINGIVHSTPFVLKLTHGDTTTVNAERAELAEPVGVKTGALRSPRSLR